MKYSNKKADSHCSTQRYVHDQVNIEISTIQKCSLELFEEILRESNRRRCFYLSKIGLDDVLFDFCVIERTFGSDT